MIDIIKKYVKGDSKIWFIIIFLCLFSLLAVFSSMGIKSHIRPGYFYMYKQLGSILAGIFVIIVMSNIPCRYYSKFSTIFLYVSIFLLVFTIFYGENINLATRSLVVPYLRVSIQTSEIAKIALIIYVARILAQYQGDNEKMAKAFKPVIIHTAIVTALIFKDNLSTSLLLFCVIIIMLVISGISFKYIFGTGTVLVAMLALLLILSPYVPFLHRGDTWINRIENFSSGKKGDNESNYQATQAKIAIATGGILGKGPGNSVQRNFLPHSSSDFIYAIIAEEYGLWGPVLILVAYFILLARIGTIVSKSKNTFPALMVIGLGFLLIIQALINMGVSVGVIPVTGQPLPMVSWGTSSMLCTSVALGAILSVSNQVSKKQKIEESLTTSDEEVEC